MATIIELKGAVGVRGNEKVVGVGVSRLSRGVGDAPSFPTASFDASESLMAVGGAQLGSSVSAATLCDTHSCFFK